jgi:PAS domain S-box-containing protein
MIARLSSPKNLQLPLLIFLILPFVLLLVMTSGLAIVLLQLPASPVNVVVGQWLVWVGLALIGTCCFGLAIAAWVVHSIAQLNAALAAIATHDLTSPIPQDLPLRELNQMVQSLNQVQKGLQESAVKLSMLLKHTKVAITQFRLFEDSTWKYDYYSAGCETIFGYTPAEMMTGIWWSRIPPEDQQAIILPAHGQLLADGNDQVEYRFRVKNGDLRWINSSYSSWRDEVNNCQVVVAVDIDISDRKRAELQQAETLKLLQLVLERMPTACIMNAPDFRITYWNSTAEKIFGFSKADAMGKLPYEFLIPDSSHSVVSEVERSLQQEKKNLTNLNENVTKDGRTILCEWVNTPLIGDGGEFLGYLSMTQDITERKRIETSLRRYERIIATTTDNIALIDLNYRYQLVNQSYAQIFNKSEREILGCSVSDLLGEETFYSVVKPQLDQCLAGQPVHYQCWFNLPDQEPRFYSITYAPYSEADQTVSGVIVSVRDMTELKRSEIDTQNLKNQLQFLQENTPAVLFTCKPDGDYGATSMSSNVRDVLGYEPEQFLTDSRFWVDRIHPEDAPGVFAKLSLLFEYGISAHEYRFLHGDGSYCWVRNGIRLIRDEQGNPAQIVGYLVDVTDVKQAELALQQLNRKLEQRVKERTYQIAETQANLRQSEELFQRVFEESPVGIAISDPVSFCMVRTNRAFQEMLGYTREELAQLSFLDITHPDDRVSNQENTEGYKKGRTNSYHQEKRYIRKDGSICWASLTASGIRNDQDEILCLLGIIEDISDRKRVETQLRRSEELFRLVFDTAPIAISMVDVQTHRIVRVNQAHRNVFGYDDADLADMDFLDFTHPDDASKDRECLQKLLASELSSYQMEKRFFCKDGRMVWANLTVGLLNEPDSTARYSLGMIEDITDRKQADIALRQSEERFATAFRANPIACAITSYPDGVLLDVNDSYLNLIGYQREEVVGQSTIEINFWQSLETRRQVLEMFQKCSSLRDMEIQFRNRTGEIRYGLVFLEKISLEEKPCLLKMLYDITERKQAEMRLQQQTEREQLLRQITQRIRQSLDLAEILSVTVADVRRTLRTDRALIFQLASDGSGTVIRESCLPGFPMIEKMRWTDQCLSVDRIAYYHRGLPRIVQNTTQDEWAPCLVDMMKEIGVKSKIVAPIVQTSGIGVTVWGLLIVHACGSARLWQEGEAAFLQQIANQVSIAIQQSNLYQKAQTELNDRVQVESRLRQSLQEKDVLFKEVHHRVKNNLQIISSMLRMQSRQVNNAQICALFQEATNRVQTMALIHEQLYQSANLSHIDFGEYLHTLVSNLFLSWGISQDQISLVIDTSGLNLDLDTAIPCGLLVNELVTNALKYAFPDQRRGTLHISLRPEVNPETNRGILTVADNGIGIPATVDWQTTRSLGLRIVRNLANQLGGDVTVDCSQGTTFQITFPITSDQTCSPHN